MPPKERPLARDPAAPNLKTTQSEAASASLPLPAPGAVAADGSIYIGISPSNKRPFSALPVEDVRRLEWEPAKAVAAKQSTLTEQQILLPSRAEWDMMMKQKNAIAEIMPKPYPARPGPEAQYYSTNSTFCVYWTRDFIKPPEFTDPKDKAKFYSNHEESGKFQSLKGGLENVIFSQNICDGSLSESVGGLPHHIMMIRYDSMKP